MTIDLLLEYFYKGFYLHFCISPLGFLWRGNKLWSGIETQKTQKKRKWRPMKYQKQVQTSNKIRIKGKQGISINLRERERFLKFEILPKSK